MIIKSRHIIRLVTLIGAVCLLFSFPVFADSVTALGNVEIYGDNNTVSTGTGTIQMQNGTVQVGSTNDSAQIVTNTDTTNTKLDSTNTKLDTINTSIGTTNTRLNTINTTLTNFRTAFDTFVTAITSPVAIMYDNIVTPYYSDSSSSRSFTIGAKNYTYNLKNIYFGGANHYFNFSGLLFYWFNTLAANISVQFSQDATSSSDGFVVTTLNTYPLRYYKYTYYTYSYTSATDVINIETNYKYFSFVSYLANILTNQLGSYISAHISYLADTWYRWYNPNISLANSKFWKAYNTDTGQYDDVNFSTVFMYITWYLGQIYDDSTNVTSTMHQMTSDINTAATTFQNMEQKEQSAINQIQQGFETFLPDPNQFQSFRAITWCSNYLQQIYLALGAYGTVIFIALMFGVCLQFIGYFRYK